MSERIVIDPITRIEGHLRVEAEIEGGTIKNAFIARVLWCGASRNKRPGSLMYGLS